jgi:hypothetical protein
MSEDDINALRRQLEELTSLREHQVASLAKEKSEVARLNRVVERLKQQRDDSHADAARLGFMAYFWACFNALAGCQCASRCPCVCLIFTSVPFHSLPFPSRPVVCGLSVRVLAHRFDAGCCNTDLMWHAGRALRHHLHRHHRRHLLSCTMETARLR